MDMALGRTKYSIIILYFSFEWLLAHMIWVQRIPQCCTVIYALAKRQTQVSVNIGYKIDTQAHIYSILYAP
ncbi:hypothetical protein ACQP3C_29670, partial [Escherichia coli]